MKKLLILSTLTLIFTLTASYTAAASFDFLFNHNKHHKKKDKFCKVLEKRIAKLTRKEERIHAEIERLDAKFEEKCEVPPPVVCPCMSPDVTSDNGVPGDVFWDQTASTILSGSCIFSDNVGETRIQTTAPAPAFSNLIVADHAPFESLFCQVRTGNGVNMLTDELIIQPITEQEDEACATAVRDLSASCNP